MSPLRQKLIDELDLRGLSPDTKKNYVRAVARLALHYGRSPDALSDDEIKAWLLHLIRERQLKASTLNVITSALRFFFETVLDHYHLHCIVTAARQTETCPIPPPRLPQCLPNSTRYANAPQKR